MAKARTTTKRARGGGGAARAAAASTSPLSNGKARTRTARVAAAAAKGKGKARKKTSHSSAAKADLIAQPVEPPPSPPPPETTEEAAPVAAEGAKKRETADFDGKKTAGAADAKGKKKAKTAPGNDEADRGDASGKRKAGDMAMSAAKPKKEVEKHMPDFDSGMASWDIRYGALEVIATYAGDEEDGDDDDGTGGASPKSTAGRYQFARLCDDVLCGEGDEDEVRVEWYVIEEEGAKAKKRADGHRRPPLRLVLTPEDGEATIALGAIICSVTGRVDEFVDGLTLEVPGKTLDAVERELERQLDDDYDPKAAAIDDGGTYEARMQKRARRKIWDFKVEDEEVEGRGEGADDENEGEGDDDGSIREPKAKRARKGRSARSPKKRTAKASARKGSAKKASVLAPRPSFALVDDLFCTPNKQSGTINAFNGDTQRASKEAIRAYLTDDKATLTKIIKDRSVVADVFVKRSVDVEMSVLDYALIAEDESTLAALTEELNRKQADRPPFPKCSLNRLSSGRHTSRYADYNRYNVGASRGGAEGNEAFTGDMVGNGYEQKRTSGLSKMDLFRIFESHDSLSDVFVDNLDRKYFNGSLIDWSYDFQKLVVWGHRELAQRAMRAMLERGVGLNQLHVDALGTPPPEGNGLDKNIRAISVTKLTQSYGGNARFCPVHCAASNPNPAYLRQLLEVAPDAVNFLDSHEGTALHYASVGDKPDTLKFLLDGPGKVLNRNAKLRKGDKSTPLMWAARAARPENIRLLCDGQEEAARRQMFETKDATGRTALHVAITTFRAARVDALRALVDGGADPNVRADARLLNKMTPLLMCAARGDMDSLRFLVEEANAKVNLADKLGRTPAMLAAKNGHRHVLSYLLRLGVDADAVDTSGNAACHYAAAYGWVECLELLLRVGAKTVDGKNSWSSTPLALALKKGRYACAVALLNLGTGEDGVDVNVCDRKGLSLFGSLVELYMEELQQDGNAPLPWAVEKMLGRDDLDVALQDSSGRTVLHIVVDLTPSSVLGQKKALELAKKLLLLGADPLLEDSDGRVPAQLAIERHNPEMCILLLEHVSHSTVCTKGKNLMHTLAKVIAHWDESQFLRVFALLEECCCEEWLDQPDNDGMTPLLLAAESLREDWATAKDTRGGKLILEKLVTKYPAHLAAIRMRRAEYRKWPTKKMQNGKPAWKPCDEYSAGSRSILHALAQCRDVAWVKHMFELAFSFEQCEDLNHVLDLKGNDGNDVVGHLLRSFFGNCATPTEPQPTETSKDSGAFDIFGDSDDDSDSDYEASVPSSSKELPEDTNQTPERNEDELRSLLELLRLLRKKGSNMNGIRHCLFASLVEARGYNNGAPVTFDLGKDEHNVKRAQAYVLHHERMHVREQLSKKSKGAPALADFFKPRLQEILCSFERAGPSSLRVLLRDCGLDTEIRDLNGNTALFVALQKRPEAIPALLDAAADTNAVNSDGETPIILATQAAKNDIVKLLLEHGANADFVSPRHGAALHIAARQQNEKLVELLLQQCSVDVRDMNQRTALHFAVAVAATSKREMLKPIETQLLLAGADVNAIDKHRRAPIHYAFVPISVDCKCVFPLCEARDPVDLLTTLAERPNIVLDAADEQGRNPLHYAAAAGASISALYLCENCPEAMKAIDQDANTPLALALRARRANTALLLISRGGEMNVPVAFVTRKRVKNGAIVETSRSTGSTLWCALNSRGEGESLARYMLAAKKLPLHIIISSLFATGNFQLAMQQIKQCRSKEDLNICDEQDGMNVLHRLAQVQSFESAPGFDVALADALIEAGINTLAVSSKGWSVIHIAAFHGHKNLISHLVNKHNLNVDVTDSSGGNPLSCMFSGHASSPELLCALVDGSSDSSVFVKNVGFGQRKEQEEERWKSLANVEDKLFDTATKDRRAEKEVIEYIKMQAVPKTATAPMLLVKSTPLIEAVRFGDVRIVNALLSYGADGASTDGDGRTALHHAVLADKPSILSLLLSWHNVPIDVVDKNGFSAIGYAVLASSQEPSKQCNLLLSYGADPLIGSALRLSVISNKHNLAVAMLQSISSPLLKADNVVTPCKIGDVVWVRYGGICGAWHMARVANKHGGTVDLLPSTTKGKLPLKTDQEKRWLLIKDVPKSWIRVVNETTEVPQDAEDVLVGLLNDASGSAEEKRALVRQFKGFEIGLRDNLRSGPVATSLLSELDVGDLIGYINCDPHVLLHVGTVLASHKNGQYDIQILSGPKLVRVSRTLLRPLRRDLVMLTGTQIKKVTANFVNACVRPFRFGSYENLTLLRALMGVGASFDTADASGQVPLDLARPGSEIQAFLCEATKSKQQRVPPAQTLPDFEDIDLSADADAALTQLHNAGADVTEKIIPPVSRMCELDSDGVAVLADGEDRYFDVALTKVDVAHGRYGKYVFYKMQIIHDPVQKVFVLFTNWGRIGEGGKYQQTPFTSREKCILEFHKVFKSKTGNLWRDCASFKRVPGKYNLVNRPATRLKHPEKLLRSVVEAPSLPCSLSNDVQMLLRGLLDLDALTAAVSGCSFNQDRLPFGQLSLSTLQAAEAKLTEIKTALENQEKIPQSSPVSDYRDGLEAVARLSSELYELLPMGDDLVAPFSSNDRRFGQAVELIRLLRDLTVTKQLLLGGMHRQATMNPLDYAYGALRVSINPLAPDSSERKCLQRYIDNTCSDEDVVVHQIFSLDNGRPASAIPNKRLLFHGSKNENVLGILKHGLLIAPPVAPTTGWMYGKGVYFADRFSKAFGYTSRSHKRRQNEVDHGPRSYVFVAEVALGESHAAFGAEYMDKPPDGKHSTQAPGKHEPDPSKSLVLDQTGAAVPLGPLQEIAVPEHAKYVWKKGRWNELEGKASTQIEKVRLDPNTEFPAKVDVISRGQKFRATLENGPESQFAQMVPFSEEEHGQGMEREADGRCEDKAKPLIRTKKGRDQPVKIERKERHRNHSEYSEFIVYDTSQIKLKYLIEITSKSWLTTTHSHSNSSAKSAKQLEACDMVSVTQGEFAGVEGELVCIDGEDAIVKLSDEDYKIVGLADLVGLG